MRPTNHTLQHPITNLRINLRRRNTLMPKQPLYMANIRALVQ